VLIPTAEEWPEFAGALGAVSLAVKAANDRFSILNAATRRYFNNAERPIHSERKSGIGYSLSMTFDW
jgi:hypothetical protein